MRFANGLRLALVAVAVWACWSAVQRRPPRNLILISIDTLRADHLGAWGYPRPSSPYLDRLAARSVRFTQAVAQAPNTVRNQFVEASAPPAEMRPAVRKQLRALGYLEE